MTQESSIFKSNSFTKYNKYNLSFSIRNTHKKNFSETAKSFRNFTTNHKIRQSQSANKLFHKYAFFHPSQTQRQYKSTSEEKMKKKTEIKWIGVKAQDKNNKSKQTYQAFPQRNKKTSNQIIVNMLFKYDRHYGHDQAEEQKKITRKNPLNHKLLKSKVKWFRRKTQRGDLSEERFFIK